jgi:hypothetical protein
MFQREERLVSLTPNDDLSITIEDPEANKKKLFQKPWGEKIKTNKSEWCSEKMREKKA